MKYTLAGTLLLVVLTVTLTPSAARAQQPAVAPPAEPPVLTEPLGSDQSATYRGTGDRDLRGYLPGPLAVIQARPSLAGTNRFAIVVLASRIELVRGATVVRTVTWAPGTMTIPKIAEVVDDPRWIEKAAQGVYLLRAALVHGRGTRLDITGPQVSELRLADRPDVFLGGVDGAVARIVDTRVVGWDERADGVDTDYKFSRPFIIYGQRARLDVLRAEIAYLGYDRGSAYGLSWREGQATGSVVDSDVHHMFFGMYSYEAKDVTLRNSRWHDCAYYGIDPHDYSTGMKIIGNEAYRNGSHGIIISRGVNAAVIRDNRSHHNRGNGIVLDARSDDAVVTGNDVRDNRGDGVVILGSSKALVERNTITGNRVGVRINLRSLDNRVVGNTVQGNRIGMEIYDGAMDTVLRENTILASVSTGLTLASASTLSRGDRISDASVGVVVRGVAELRDTRIDDVTRGIDVRETGILQAHDLRVSAERVGVQLREKADAELHRSRLSAPEAVSGELRREAGNVRELPFAWLTAAGVLFLALAVVLQVLHRLRNRDRIRLVAPDGVSNIR